MSECVYVSVFACVQTKPDPQTPPSLASSRGCVDKQNTLSVNGQWSRHLIRSTDNGHSSSERE